MYAVGLVTEIYTNWTDVCETILERTDADACLCLLVIVLLYICKWRSWIHASWYNCTNNQLDALYRLIYYSKSALHVSGDVFAHHQEHLTVFAVSGSVHPRCCQMVSWMSWNCYAVSTHPWHQPAASWVNTTRYCKYSQVLLMMGENIARNMQSWSGIIN